MRDLLVLSKWFEGMETAPEEDLREIGFRVVQLVLGKEAEIDDSKDIYPMAKVWKDIKKDAIGTYDAYIQKKQYGEQHGKKMNPISIDIWKYCQNNDKVKAPDVAKYLIEEMGYREEEVLSNSKKGQYSKIYDFPGWKNRNKLNWLEELGISEDSEKNSDRNSEKIIRNSEGNSEEKLENSDQNSESSFNF